MTTKSSAYATHLLLSRRSLSCSKSVASAMWCLTFDMSGGPKGAKRPLGRPLDGGVRRHDRTHDVAGYYCDAYRRNARHTEPASKYGLGATKAETAVRRCMTQFLLLA